MGEHHIITTLGPYVLFLIELVFIARAILRPHREPASRVAWVVVMLVLPVIGVVTYILLGETNIGRRRAARVRKVLAQLPDVSKAPGTEAANVRPEIPDRYEPLVRVGHSVNGFEPVGGNRGHLLPDSNATIESIIADMMLLKIMCISASTSGCRTTTGSRWSRH